MLQIADGALSEVNDILVRLSSLSVQSASGQLSDSERALLDSEFQNLLSEVDRISQDTEFNGNQLLNGGDVAATTNEAITGSLASKGMSISYDTNKVTGAEKNDTDNDGTVDQIINGDLFDVAYDSATENLTLTNKTTGEVVTQNIKQDLDKVAGATNNLASDQFLDVEFKSLGVTIKLDNDFDRAANFDDSLSIAASAGTPPTYTNLQVADTAGVNSSAMDVIRALPQPASFDPATNTVKFDVVDDGAGNVTFQDANFMFSVDGAPAANPTPNLDDNAAHTITVYDATGATALFDITVDDIATAANSTTQLEITLPENMFGADEQVKDTATFQYQVGTGTSASDRIDVTIDGASTTSLGINSTNIATQAAATSAIDEVKAAIDTLQDVRANIGASLSRLDFASSNLSVAIENSESAKSGLLDVDVATETTKYTAEQVIVQAGVSLLAQANQRPNTLLSLLQQ
jgi:flagellin